MILQTIISQGYSLQHQKDFSLLYIDTKGDGSELKALDPFFTYSVGYNAYDNHWYIAMGTTGGAPNNRATEVYKINSSLEVVQSYVIPLDTSITSSYDIHPLSVIDFDSFGNFYLSRELGKNSIELSDGHGTNLLLYKTTIQGDLSSLTILKTINGFYSYPNLWVNSTGIFLTARGNISSIQEDEHIIHRSLDGGINFITKTVFNTLIGNEGRAYVQKIQNYDTNEIIEILNIRKNSSKSFEAVYILRSLDGIIWSNWSGSFKKNIDTGGYITLAELDANFLVWEKPNNEYSINFEGGVYKNGKLELLISKSLVADVAVEGNIYQTYEELRLYTYNNGWTYVDLSEILPKYYSVWALQRVLQLCWDSENSYIIIIDKTGTKDIVYEYSSSNNFKTYTYSILSNLPNSYYFGSHSFNADVNTNRLLCLLDIKGDIYDFNSSANLLLYSPK